MGLHADESWFGLKAVEFIQGGIDRPYGMNYYTGIFQSLIDAAAFKLSGTGIFQMRIGGVLINIVSLALVVVALTRNNNSRIAFYFLLLFAQCGLYLLYPKIAWEVCSLTLFFFVLCSIALMKLYENKDRISPFWMFVFFSASMAGTYNHILFSSFPLALVTGYAIWRLYQKQTQADNVFPVLMLNMINLVWFHLFMKYAIDFLWTRMSWFSFLLPIGILVLEAVYRNKKLALLNRIFNPLFIIRFSRPLAIGLLVVASLAFLIFHSITFFEIAAQRVLFLQLYSYELPLLLKWVFFMAAAVLMLILGYSILNDIRKNAHEPFAFFLIGYLGVFTIYTQSYSIRYYLIMTLLVLFYLAWLLARRKNDFWKKIISVLLLLNAIMLQYTLWNLSFDEDRITKAIDFKIGNNQNTETSAHFLPFDQVIHYARENKAGQIGTSDTFFIENNFRFYKLIYPELNQFPDTVRVEYNRDNSGDAFVMWKE